ncbi:MAG: N-acetyltransferase family protein [Gemmatimonadaceae bacterium]|nr:N-acetyltransferase family protein [Gemmatimonadaceae bacterium]
MSSSSPAPLPHVRDAVPADADAIAAIYNHYVTETTITFEEEAIDGDELRRRMAAVHAASLPYLVAELDGRIGGYAYATKWKERVGYRFSAEISVYLAHDLGGRGLGSALYAALLERLRARGVHAVLGGIALPNAASVALHEKFGMVQVAHFRETGRKFGEWIDVGYWERILEPGA